MEERLRAESVSFPPNTANMSALVTDSRRSARNLTYRGRMYMQKLKNPCSGKKVDANTDKMYSARMLLDAWWMAIPIKGPSTAYTHVLKKIMANSQD